MTQNSAAPTEGAIQPPATTPPAQPAAAVVGVADPAPAAAGLPPQAAPPQAAPLQAAVPQPAVPQPAPPQSPAAVLAAPAAALAVAAPVAPAPAAPPVVKPIPAAPQPTLSVVPATPAPVEPVSPPLPKIIPPVATPAAIPVATPAVIAAPPVNQIRPPATASRLQKRHVGVMLSFLLLAVLPTLVSAWYLWARAADQYASTLGFSVHKESNSSALTLLTGLSSLSGSSSADTDIIYNYINSQQLVVEIDQAIDLRAIWSKPDDDFVYSLDPTGSTEDLVDYWKKMVNVYYDSTTRLIEIRALAFDPDDAQKITTIIYEKSTEMINELNDIAVIDSIRYADEELKKTHEEVIKARQAMTFFRNKNQIVDPSADVAVQTTIIASLQQELAVAMIELDVLKDGGVAADPRISQMERRIRVIEERIKIEKTKLGLGTASGEGNAYADIVAEFERLTADREFAEASYMAARAAHDAAQSENSRKTRYLAAHITPTLADSSRYPDRPVTVAAIAVFLFMLWSIGTLLFYSFRDRR